ncbi:MAG: hypothetical protein QM768_18995 [Agriterribacter sp.]
MPTYIANIQLQEALVKDYALLNGELEQRSFNAHTKTGWKHLNHSAPFTHTVNFIRRSEVIREVIADIKLAAQKTGKPFSFTVIKRRDY